MMKSKCKHKCISCLIVLLLVAILAGQAGAITRTWDNGAGNNDWFTATNWDPDGSPADSDNLTINSGSPATTSSVFTSNDGAITFNPGTSGSFGGLYPGYNGTGTLDITGGADVTSSYSSIGFTSGSTGTATVDGSGSTWDTGASALYVGDNGTGTLNITGGGKVTSTYGYIGVYSGSTGIATVDGIGSTWDMSGYLYVGHYGDGTLNITDGGLVSVADTLTIDYDSDGDGFINMATGGMLALFGEADGSLSEFLDLINGTDAIRYWNDSISDWADITTATYGVDYTLTYLTAGDLAGYTVLTIPEPATIALLGLGSLILLHRKRNV